MRDRSIGGGDGGPGADGPSLRDLHDTDFYAWTRAQADSLRRLALEPVGAALGADRLADEVEAMGEEHRRAAMAELRDLLALRLQLRHGRAPEPRGRLAREIGAKAAALRERLTPSLARAAAGELEALYAGAADLARRRLELAGDRTAALAFPLRCPWSTDGALAAGP